MNNNGTSPTISPYHSHPTITSNIIITVIIALFLVIGTIGSFTTAIVIGKNKQLHSKANIFIFSLCISDLISGLVCSPFWLYRRTWGYQYWYLDKHVCRFYWISDYATNYITSLHIASFSALRYAAIKRPFLEVILSKKNVICYVILLWIVSAICALPLGYLMDVDLDRVYASVGSCWPSCSIANRKDCCLEQYKIYIEVINPLLFYLPQFFIAVFSLLLAWEIRKISIKRQEYFENYPSAIKSTDIGRPDVNANPRLTQSKNLNSITEPYCSETIKSCKSSSLTWNQEAAKVQIGYTNEKSAFLQLILIVIAYGIGYIPTVVYLQWTTTVPATHKGADVDYWFGIASYLTLRLSECINPIMYNVGSSTLRKETKKLYKSMFCRNS